MGEWRKAFWLEGLYDERETRERGKLKKWEIFFMLTNEHQASLNS